MGSVRIKESPKTFGEWCDLNTELTGGFDTHQEFIDYLKTGHGEKNKSFYDCKLGSNIKITLKCSCCGDLIKNRSIKNITYRKVSDNSETGKKHWELLDLVTDKIYCDKCSKYNKMEMINKSFESKNNSKLIDWLNEEGKGVGISVEEEEKKKYTNFSTFTTSTKKKINFYCEYCKMPFEARIDNVTGYNSLYLKESTIDKNPYLFDDKHYYSPRCCTKNITYTLQDWTLLLWGFKILGEGYDIKPQYTGKLVYECYKKGNNSIDITKVLAYKKNVGFKNASFCCNNSPFQRNVYLVTTNSGWCNVKNYKKNVDCLNCQKQVLKTNLCFYEFNENKLDIYLKKLFNEVKLSKKPDIINNVGDFNNKLHKIIRRNLRETRKMLQFIEEGIQWNEEVEKTY